MQSIYKIKRSGISHEAITVIERTVSDLAGWTIDGCLLASTELSWACYSRSTLSGERVIDGIDVVAPQVVKLVGAHVNES